MIRTILFLVLLTMAPTLELRASIPYGLIDAEISWAAVVAICIAANIALAPLVWLFMDKGVGLALKIRWIADLYERVVVRTRSKLEPYIEKWGTLGLALFIGVPLPGSGVYSGGLGGYLLGMTFRQYILASILGVCIAASLVTAAVLSGATAFQLFLKH